MFGLLINTHVQALANERKANGHHMRRPSTIRRGQMRHPNTIQKPPRTFVHQVPNSPPPRAGGYPAQVPPKLTIGCTLPASSVASEPAALAALAQAAEGLGYDSLWLSDHVVIPERIESAYPYSPDGRFPTPATQPYLEPLAGLTYLSGVTKRVRLGTHVLILPYRHPLLTAKMVATLDNVSGGRFDLGIGVGWMREEFEALGLEERVFTRRGAATDEQLRILKTVWTEDVASFEGEFYRSERVGRDASRLQLCFSTAVSFEPPDDPRRPFSGSSEQIAADFESYREVGVDSFLVGFGSRPLADYEQRLRRFAEEVRTALGARPVG